MAEFAVNSDITTIDVQIRPSSPTRGSAKVNSRVGDLPARCRLGVFRVDHIIPRGAGGQNNIENPQLLCAPCNRVEDDRPQEYLIARLSEVGIAG